MILNIFHRFFNRVKKQEGVYDLVFEQRKLAILRIIAGIILVYRWGEITHTSYYYFQDSTHFYISLIPLAASIFLLAGILTPLVNIFIFITFLFFDTYFLSRNLGSGIFLVVNFIFFFTGAGYRYSADALLIRFRPVAWLYRKTAFTSPEKILYVYYLGFLSYGIISFGAVAYHFNDPYWITGQTGHAMFVSTYLSRFPDFFRSIEQLSPAFMTTASKAAIIIQMIFQVLMIPLLLNRYGRRFVIVWGMCFFLCSLFLLQLSYLPWIEIILWTAIFWHRKNRLNEMSEHTQPAETGRLNRLLRVMLVIYFIYFIFRMPGIGPQLKAWAGKHTVTSGIHFAVNEVLYRFGLETPEVFNTRDIQNSNRWFIMYRNSERTDRIPIYTMNGERLNYFGYNFLLLSNHNSDILYTGNTVRYRRGILDSKDLAKTHKKGSETRKRLEYLAMFDYRVNHFTGKRYYYFDIIGNNQTTLDSSIATRYQAHILYRDSIPVELKSGKAIISGD